MQEWIKTEVENQVMGDVRLNKRLATLINTLSVEPSRSIPCANNTWAETFAAYRFFDNDNVDFDSIMSGHKAATLNRIKVSALDVSAGVGPKVKPRLWQP
jgi:hypothetical protein